MKRSLFNIFLSLIAIPASTLAANVAVIDSGTDYAHNWLKDKTWVNHNEVNGNMIDDDKNGKVDDINGWNFAENSPNVFYREHLSTINPIIFKVFETLSRIQLNRATPEDVKFWKDNVTSLPQDKKNALLAQLNFYGEYAHSTHCSGIIAKVNDDSILLSARIFPDKLPPEYDGKAKNVLYDVFAGQFNKTFINIGKYLNEANMEVANMSIGTPLPALAQKYLALAGNKNPTPEQIRAETLKIFTAFETKAKPWVDGTPGVLFVIAAGNDHNDNDNLPYFPANLKAENTITVAASNGYEQIADFSNYGKTSVHVAAPGVAIDSSVPGLNLNQTLPMSGTSMAAPFVTGVASKIKDYNFKLSAKEVKEILMGTVDKKDWLKEKVITSGIVNPERAYKAAEYAKGMSLADAIKRARIEVQDKPELPSSYGLPQKNKVSITPEMESWAKQLVF